MGTTPKPTDANQDSHATAVVTVRMTREQHERAKAAAWARRQSLNRFCIDAIMASVLALEGGGA